LKGSTILAAYRDVFLGANRAWGYFATRLWVADYSAGAAVVEFSAMRRVQAILVIVALLATPLALLARAVEPGMPDCNGMCCLPHGGHHQSPVRNSSPEPQKDDVACHHGALGHIMECSMRSGEQRMDYGLIAPFPPGRTSTLAFIEQPKASRFANSQFPAGNLSAGFLAGPFQPPRS
jgi:hypothetical protein